MRENNSLFYEYAITPDVFDASYIASDSRLEVIIVELLKGICINGMIADMNNGEWKKTVYGRLEKLSPNLKDKISKCLERLSDRHRLVFHPQNSNFNPTSITAWLNTALTTPLDGIIASHEVLESSGQQNSHFINALEVLDSNVWIERRRTMTLKTSNAYYSPVLKPILRHASSLIIVDPYFSLDEPRFKKFLQLCLKHMGKRSGGNDLPGRITIHAGVPEKDSKAPDKTVEERIDARKKEIQSRKDLWKRSLINITKDSPHEFRVYLRSRGLNGGARFHDRYILTDQCCVVIPLGTDIDNDETSTTTTWCLLDNEDMKKKYDEIFPENKIFQVLGGIRKHPNGRIDNIPEML